MFGIGHFPELVLVLVLALIFVGPGKLPEIGGALGKGLREFRKQTSDLQNSITMDAPEVAAPRQLAAPSGHAELGEGARPRVAAGDAPR